MFYLYVIVQILKIFYFTAELMVEMSDDASEPNQYPSNKWLIMSQLAIDIA